MVRRQYSTHGFTLIELSIVLVIVGLLIGGVLSGRTLLRASELRSLTNDYQKYSSAVVQFRDKYNALPGDMPNAYSYWAGQGSCSYDTVVNATSVTACNGNGDGNIDLNTGEAFKTWFHLKLAGMIEGGYTGLFADNWGGYTPYYCFIIDVNTPGTKVSKSSFFAMFSTILTARGWWSGGDSSSQINFIMYDDWANKPLTVSEAWSIDTKLDDGKPGSGRVTADQSTYTCSTGASHDITTATYDTANSSAACQGLDFNID